MLSKSLLHTTARCTDCLKNVMSFYLKQKEQQVRRRTCLQPLPSIPSSTHPTLNFFFIVIIFIFLSSLELPSPCQLQNDASFTMDNRPSFIRPLPRVDLDL